MPQIFDANRYAVAKLPTSVKYVFFFLNNKGNGKWHFENLQPNIFKLALKDLKN